MLRDNTDVSDPRSLIAIANIHGTTIDPANWPAGVGPQIWNACQHSSWYFLPWHRWYLYYFEEIVAATWCSSAAPRDGRCRTGTTATRQIPMRARSRPNSRAPTSRTAANALCVEDRNFGNDGALVGDGVPTPT